jgi:hypothetical protein
MALLAAGLQFPQGAGVGFMLRIQKSLEIIGVTGVHAEVVVA